MKMNLLIVSKMRKIQILMIKKTVMNKRKRLLRKREVGRERNGKNM